VGLANMSDPRFFELGWLTQRIWTWQSVKFKETCIWQTCQT
jgi:hypothetical protein